FFQAEDGIRDFHVTGVQTCALPILVDTEGRLVIPEFTNALTGTTIMRAVELLKDEMPIVFQRVREDDIYRAREVLMLGTTGDCEIGRASCREREGRGAVGERR